MTPCARGCCWSPYTCSRQRTCPCHWDDKRPAKEPGDGRRHRDPTANQAIANIMRGKK